MNTFGTLRADGTLTNVRIINQSDLAKCPYFILVAEHYREDNICRCNDPAHVEMIEWGYIWNDEAGIWQAPDQEEN